MREEVAISHYLEASGLETVEARAAMDEDVRNHLLQVLAALRRSATESCAGACTLTHFF